MRQEAEERKILEQQKKQVEKEEEKYKAEISKIEESLLISQENEMLEKLKARLEELQNQLDNVEHKKQDIVKRQNGKAGYVYIISNLGSFGDKTFKVGMTRRLNPQDRVDELGDASVPFVFDVHSFIFSDDAVALEKKLHDILNDKRTNKINLRKEFFNVSIDELEKLVQEIEPTAEFNRTMAAEQYRQTLSINQESEILV
ncbi:MAG: GIY-YIG nuclease family protein [Clostridium sp.]|nr:GIY-YIG nuclease family protein [Clostridium sp.]